MELEFLKRDELKLERDEWEVGRGADTDKPYTKQSSERGAREERERSGQRQAIQQTPTGHTGNT